MMKDNEMDGNNSRRIEALAAIPMAGMIVAAKLLLGLSPFEGYYLQAAIAQQQNMTEVANATSTGCTTATTTRGSCAAQSSSVCTPAQSGGGGDSGAGTQGGNTTSTPANSSPSANSLTGSG